VFVVKGHIHKFHPDDDSWSLPHAVGYAKDKWINPHPDNPLRYTNHSCDANCILSAGLKVKTLRGIKKGKEITLNYSLTEGDAESVMGPCWCGSNDCKKNILTVHHLTRKEFERYKRYLPKWIIDEYNKNKVK
jgi:hypothetical protein